MALNNILALFLLPIFGALSDKVNSRHGRRTPFIVIGTLVAAVAFVALAFVTMIFVRHGDSRPTAKKGLEVLEDMD